MTTSLKDLQRGAVERFKETLFAKSGGSCFECSDFEGMYVDLQSFLTSEVANVYEAVTRLHATELNSVLNKHSKSLAEGGLDYMRAFVEAETYEHELFGRLQRLSDGK